MRQSALFVGWAVAGVGLLLGFVELGPAGMFPAAMLALFLSTRDGAGPAAWGLLAGAGALPLLLAYENRQGPGEHCWSSGESYSCSQLNDPRPFLVVGLVLVAASVTATVIAWRR